MVKYVNLFEKYTDEELYTIFEQYEDWRKGGYISEENRELRHLRNEYLELFESNTLYMLERDLLYTMAKRFYTNKNVQNKE